MKNGVVKKTEYNSLKRKVDNIDITNFVFKTNYEDSEDKISKIPKQIYDVSDLVKKTYFNSKINEVESKISSISGVATNSALTVVENKITDVSSLVKKADCHTKICEIKNKVNDHNHDKYITTPEFNTLAAVFLKQD